MRRGLLAVILALMLWMVSVGCRTSSRPGRAGTAPEPDAARAAEVPTAELAEGRRLSETKCVKCHRFYNPADYGRSEWDLWMKKMSRKARLKADEERVLLPYLELFRPAAETGK